VQRSQGTHVSLPPPPTPATFFVFSHASSGIIRVYLDTGMPWPIRSGVWVSRARTVDRSVVLCCPVKLQALRRDDPSSSESHRTSYNILGTSGGGGCNNGGPGP
jgi:hypothetical protein